MLSFFKSGFQKIKHALKKSRAYFVNKLTSLFSKPLDDETLQELEAVLFEADLGSKTVIDFLNIVENHHKNAPSLSFDDYKKLFEQRALEILSEPAQIQGNTPLPGSPQVILIIGVNGSGKTTTIAKLANLLQKGGKKILLVAGDTFRAAAREQLEVHAKRLKLDLVQSPTATDPSSVLFDAMMKAQAKHFDILISDTAGRLESKTELMHELKKMQKTLKKFDPLAPHETYFIVDTTLGQTAIEQVRIFQEYIPITGLILTKIDSCSKGGTLLAIYRELKIPIHYVCFGEKIEDIELFDKKAYTEGLFVH